jgi:hypothetical protein
MFSLKTTLAIRNGHKAPQAVKRRGRLLAATALSVIGSASSTSAAVVLTDDNRYVVTSSHNLLPVILLFALLFVFMAALWIIRTH